MMCLMPIGARAPSSFCMPRVSPNSLDGPRATAPSFGVGTGTITRRLVARGFHGLVYDLGEEARAALRRDVFPPGGLVRVVGDPDDVAAGSVDYPLAFEIL